MQAFALGAVGVLGQGLLPGQVLARPGWAGSGVASEPWWRSAVIYRLDPARFQDSDGDGVGDLPGVSQRLDYLQELGVDAILLDRLPPSRIRGAAQEDQSGDDGLDDLVRSASNHRIRLLMTISPELQNGNQPALLDLVHHWLSLGVAGVWLPKPLAPGADAAAAEARFRALREALGEVLRAMPGERLLLSDPAPGAAGPSQTGRGTGRAAAPVRLTTSAVLPVEPPDAVALGSSLASLPLHDSPGSAALLRFAGRPRTGSPDSVAEAALLLGSRGAAILNFGDEIGLNTSAPASSADSSTLPVMQWTPGNGQGVAPAPIERRPASPQPEFGAYRPYIRPPSTLLTGPVPAAPRATVDGDIPAALPDIDTLPGFTTGKLPVPPTRYERLNAAAEERDPHSTLAAYRLLIALHHGNPAVRSGGELVLPTSAANTVVWVRHRPAGSVASDVLGAVNLSDAAVTLNLDGLLAQAGMRPGGLRALFTFAAAPLTGEMTGSLRLPPHSAYLGEWTHTRSRRERSAQR